MINKMRKLFKNNKGFTLVELIVVIAILGILSAVAIPRLTGVRNNAEANADEASIRTIQSAISIAEASGDLDLNGSTAPDTDDIVDAIVPRYLAEIPEAQSGEGWNVVIGATAPYTITISVAATATDAEWDN